MKDEFLSDYYRERHNCTEWVIEVSKRTGSKDSAALAVFNKLGHFDTILEIFEGNFPNNLRVSAGIIIIEHIKNKKLEDWSIRDFEILDQINKSSIEEIKIKSKDTLVELIEKHLERMVNLSNGSDFESFIKYINFPSEEIRLRITDFIVETAERSFSENKDKFIKFLLKSSLTPDHIKKYYFSLMIESLEIDKLQSWFVENLFEKYSLIGRSNNESEERMRLSCSNKDYEFILSRVFEKIINDSARKNRDKYEALMSIINIKFEKIKDIQKSPLIDYFESFSNKFKLRIGKKEEFVTLLRKCIRDTENDKQLTAYKDQVNKYRKSQISSVVGSSKRQKI